MVELIASIEKMIDPNVESDELVFYGQSLIPRLVDGQEDMQRDRE